MAKTVLHVTAARLQQQTTSVTRHDASHQRAVHPLLAWDDLPATGRPIAFDIVVNALPGSLIENSVFDGVPGPYLLATFADQEPPVQFPLRMGYYGENLCESW